MVSPDKTKTNVSIYYLESLKDINKVGEIAWGMAILAYTYHHLGLASGAEVRSITGCLTLIAVRVFVIILIVSFIRHTIRFY